jgi:hypothetical protein
MPRDREIAGRTSELSTLALVSGFIRGFRRFSQITEAGAAREACGSDEEAAAPRRRPGRLVRANASQSVTAVATSP